MPQTIEKNSQNQIIAGVFSDPKNADKATVAFQQMGVPSQDIQTIVQPDKNAAGKVYTTDLQEYGISEPQARYHNVMEPKPVIEVFDRFGAEYNPDGSRNVRQDVAGLTAGTGAGAIVGAGVGLVTAGPVGAAVGAAAGAVLGGGAGAAAGKTVEHKK
jgi:hypothetical protein